jgi:hypothetical protein
MIGYNPVVPHTPYSSHGTGQDYSGWKMSDSSDKLELTKAEEKKFKERKEKNEETRAPAQGFADIH